MKNLTIIILGFLFLAACTKENVTNSLQWTIGDETDLEMTKTFNSNGNTSFFFKTEDSELCPTHGVQVIVKEGNNELLNEEIVTHPSSFEVEIPLNSSIEISTKIVELNPQPFILCKRLGEVKCIADF